VFLNGDLIRSTRDTASSPEVTVVPTLGQVMRRPKWMGMLALTLIVAAAFALLGHWQLERAMTSGAVVERATETPVPLAAVVAPNAPMHETDTGQMVTATGVYVPEDYDIVANRINGGRAGYWVIGHVVDDNGVGIAVACGWVSRVNHEEIIGRFLPSQAPQVPDGGDILAAQTMTTMSVAALVNRWSTFNTGEVYTGYVVVRDAPAGLERIDSLPPEQQLALNWLNVFYAGEWVVFAGFAIFFWYRLAKDSWEREVEQYGHIN
jgi:surfeit locus 1 family protein